jgi:hypothetical protein
MTSRAAFRRESMNGAPKHFFQVSLRPRKRFLLYRPYVDWPTVVDAGEFSYRTRVNIWTVVNAGGYKLTLAGIRCRKRMHETFL